MKIGIDISQIVYEGTGTATYTKNLVENLLKIDKKNDYVLFGSSLRRQTQLKQFTRKIWPFPPTFLDFVWNKLHTFPVEKLIGPVDVFQSSDWTQPPTKAKKVAPVLDMVVYKFPQFSHPQIIATQKRRLKWVKKEADRIVTISQASKNDLVEILGIPPQIIKVIYLAPAKEFGPQSKEKVATIREKYNLQKDYVLAVGTREPRKNLDRVVEAFSKLNKPNLELVIAGKAGWGKEPKANLLGFVPQEDLPALYAGAYCFVYPSLYEGFGFPVLEAMACGCPVITSKVGSLPEVGGQAALYVDPENVSDIAEKIDSVDQSLVAKGLTQAKKFSWEKTARETLKVYEEVA